ncbi:MFS transporter [Methylocystis parvus]|uniref:MFS transporter n=1 Tax=Methylocystis parvus TaxID=134 RepID=A0A6B8M130_9HYPH|nr:MFS transporter [Methylocystis parvus]QGM98567.1 MFS transporter [Methylocystis parvus]WBK01091.1 MFS transporter [Methylocystis parvus OBBP]
MTDDASRRFSRLRQIPPSVWALGLVSLFMDFSSEMIHALLPIYLVGTMGATMAQVGVIEGVAEATASIVKIFSGAISDWFGNRKLLAILGYGLAAATKPMFPLAPNVGWVTTARFIDRVGKGIRGAPRDALVADVTPPELRGAAFGLRQSLDTVGAFLGPAVAVLVMWATVDDIRAVFWIACIPAVVAVAVLAFGVSEPEETRPARPARFPLHWNELKGLGGVFWLVVGVSTLFSLARFSEAFLILEAQAVGLPDALAPLVLVAMNVVYAAASYPAGAFSDRGDRVTPLVAGLIALIAADAALGFARSQPLVWVGVGLWGLHMGLTQGLFAALIADSAPAGLRGTAFGVFNLSGGLALLLASFAAGKLWDVYGSSVAFAAGGVFAALALIGLLISTHVARRRR